jgi:3-oxoadipate enol-lactonase
VWNATAPRFVPGEARGIDRAEAMEQLAISEGDLTAARAGSGRDLVILHSLLTDRAAFDAVLPRLAARFRVTLPNLPGFHGSKPVDGGIAGYVGWIARALDAFDIGADPILMGNGFGGTLALAFALAHGDRVGRLVLCDVAPGFPDAGRQAFRIMAATAAEGGMGAIAEIAAKRVFHTVHLGKYPQAIEERREVLEKVDPVGFRAACMALVEVDLVADLSSLAVPTLVICGELDQATPPELNRLIATKVVGERYIELPHCGHCPPLEQPEAFLAAAEEFLAGLDS